MRVNLVGTLLASLLAVGVIAPAAMAGDIGIGIIENGRAQVGTANDTCTKDTQTKPTGNGIVIPNGGETHYKYRLQVPNKTGVGSMLVVGTSTNGDNGKEPGEIRIGNGTLSICGNVGPVGGGLGGVVPSLGAWCGMSKGYNGTGTLTVNWTDDAGDDDIQRYQISDLGWKASVGTVLPTIGKWRKLNDAGTKKKNTWGNVVALVSARSVAGQSTCLTPGTGGQAFDVDGVTALVSNPADKSKGSVVRPKDLPDGDEDYNDNPVTCKGTTCPIWGPNHKPAPPKDDVPNNS